MDTISIQIERNATIRYCVKCNWLARAAWMAQELLTTFRDELDGVTLKPSQEAGVFGVYLGEYMVWDRKKFGGFPQPAELKQRVRNVLCPEKNLGHSDDDDWAS